MYHALFDIEPTVISSREIDLYEYHDFLKSWNTKRNEYLSGPEDSEDTKNDKRKKYDLWRYEYPMNEARETSERLRMLRKKKQLEQELRELNDKLNSGYE